MRKQDLQNFDIVETRAGWLFMVCADERILFGEEGWINLGDYDDSLNRLDHEEDYEIEKVRRPNHKSDYGPYGRTVAPVIWERKEIPELSSFERALLENTKMKHIARNKNGNLAFFEKKPSKDMGTCAWGPRGGESGKLKSNILVDIFAFITWEDSEPWSVEELLREAQ